MKIMEDKNSWIKRILGFNGHEEEPRKVNAGGGFQALDKAIATAIVWCVAAVLLLRFRNPEFGFIAGGLAVAVTVYIWKRR